MTIANSEWRSFPSPQGEIEAFAVRPAVPPPWPALIVIHPVTGLTEAVQQLCATYAGQGYYAIAPNVYSPDEGYKQHAIESIEAAAHMGPNPGSWDTYLAKQPAAKRDAIRKAREWVSARPGATYIDIIRGCYDDLASRPDIGAVASIGYCMGGRLTLELAATGADLAAGVVYYGGHPGVEAVASIRCPIQGHYGVTDRGITGKVYEFALAMSDAGKEFAYTVYNANHGFASRDCEATRQAFAASSAFLAKHLKAPAEVRAAE